MKKLLFVLCCVTVLFVMPMMAGASVLNFDDLNSSNSHQYAQGYGDVPTNYGGFTWYWWGYIDYWPDIEGSLGVVSQTQVAYNGAGGDTWIASETPFTFNGAYFTAWYLNDLSINIKGYFQGSLIEETTVEANTSGPVYASLDWSGIDLLTFAAGGLWEDHFSMDNFTYNETTVPEPASLLLLGLGLMVLAGMRRKIKS